MIYTAKLGLNTRDTNTLSPMILLRGIVDQNDTEFRDHCWIPLKGAITKVVPTTNRVEYIIQFEADEKEYYKNRTLDNIKNIRIIAKGRK
mgnify:FL=1